jgi:hypothetical protein
MVAFGHTYMHANRQMKQNVLALLKGRRLTQRDLAQWCRRSESWLSKNLELDSVREIPLKYWDRIADFFGISTYQLLQPGIGSATERRKGDRRTGKDRRSRSQNPAHQTGFTDQSLVQEVLSVPYDERPFLFASIAELKRKRAAPPNQQPHGGRDPSASGPRPVKPREPAHRKGPRRDEET